MAWLCIGGRAETTSSQFHGITKKLVIHTHQCIRLWRSGGGGVWRAAAILLDLYLVMRLCHLDRQPAAGLHLLRRCSRLQRYVGGGLWQLAAILLALPVIVRQGHQVRHPADGRADQVRRLCNWW